MSDCVSARPHSSAGSPAFSICSAPRNSTTQHGQYFQQRISLGYHASREAVEPLSMSVSIKRLTVKALSSVLSGTTSINPDLDPSRTWWLTSVTGFRSFHQSCHP